MNRSRAPTLSDIAARYADESARAQYDTNIELEVRIKNITRDIFMSVYKKMLADKSFASGKLECTINTIFPDETSQSRFPPNNIRSMIFTGGSKTAEVLKKKASMGVVHVDAGRVATDGAGFGIPFTVGLSSETTLTSLPTIPTNALIRFKIRVSFDYIPAGADSKHPALWRFDLTAVKSGSLDAMGKDLKKYVSMLFKPTMSYDNLERELDLDLIDRFEIEIEHIGADRKNVDFSVVKKVAELISGDSVQNLSSSNELYHVARHIVGNPILLDKFKRGQAGVKELANQVIALSKVKYYQDFYPPEGFYLTDKADGKRCIISIRGSQCKLLTGNELIEGRTKSTETEVVSNTIGDAEMLRADEVNAEMLPKKNGATKTPKYYLFIFDSMVYRDNNLSGEGIGVRVGYCEKIADIINQHFSEELNCVAYAKKYIRLESDQLEEGFKEIYEGQYPYRRDGLILTEPDRDYMSTRNIKWKPAENNTIDFLAIKCPTNMLGIAPYIAEPGHEVYLLFVMISADMRDKLSLGLISNYKQIFTDAPGQYYPIQFSPSINPLAYIYQHPVGNSVNINHKIVELRLVPRDKNHAPGAPMDVQNAKWEFERVREDKMGDVKSGDVKSGDVKNSDVKNSDVKNGDVVHIPMTANNFAIAETTYINYIDPFNFEDLYKYNAGYFAKSAEDMYKASNRYKRFVIGVVMKANLTGVKWMVDAASGRGADLNRYDEITTGDVLFMDIDSTAIAELIRRKLDMVRKQGRGNAARGNNDIKGRVYHADTRNYFRMHTMVADLKTPYDVLISRMAVYGAFPGNIDAIMCNFALHYLCDTIENIRNVLQLNATLLKKGGLFMFTTMSGARIFDLLKPLNKGQTWVRYPGGGGSSVNDIDIVNNRPKYAIRKMYSSDKLSPAGQMISVLLPMANEMYDEPLANIDVIVDEARKLGFELELNESFGHYYDQFEKFNPELHSSLTKDDREYINLHQVVTLRLVRKSDKEGGDSEFASNEYRDDLESSDEE